MAPPRFMVDWGFVDTVTLHSNSYRVMQPPSLVNQYAAMPSLHAGWDLLMGIAIVSSASRRAVRALGFVLPVLMYLAIVLTANHYFTDGIVGATVALIGLGAATWLHSRRQSTEGSRDSRPAPSLGRGQVALSPGD
jgi:membrane-associated phospholipid phosphatase